MTDNNIDLLPTSQISNLVRTSYPDLDHYFNYLSDCFTKHILSIKQTNKNIKV